MNELIYNLLNFFLIFTEDISLVFLCETFFIKKFQGRSFFFSVLFLVLFNCIGLAFGFTRYFPRRWSKARWFPSCFFPL